MDISVVQHGFMTAAIGMEFGIGIHLDRTLALAAFLDVRIVPLIADDNPVLVFSRRLLDVGDADRPGSAGTDICRPGEGSAGPVDRKDRDRVAAGVHDQHVIADDLHGAL